MHTKEPKFMTTEELADGIDRAKDEAEEKEMREADRKAARVNALAGMKQEDVEKIPAVLEAVRGFVCGMANIEKEAPLAVHFASFARATCRELKSLGIGGGE